MKRKKKIMKHCLFAKSLSFGLVDVSSREIVWPLANSSEEKLFNFAPVGQPLLILLGHI